MAMAALLPIATQLLGGMLGGGGGGGGGSGGGGSAPAASMPIPIPVPQPHPATAIHPATLMHPAFSGMPSHPAQHLAVRPNGELTVQTHQQTTDRLLSDAQRAALLSHADEHTNRAARSQIRHITGAIDPQLATIQSRLDRMATSAEATAEHRRIVQNEDFQRAVLADLQQLLQDQAATQRAIRAHHAATTRTVNRRVLSRF